MKIRNLHMFKNWKFIVLAALALILVITPNVSCKKSGAGNNNNNGNNNQPPVVGVYYGNIATSFNETASTGVVFNLDSFKGKVILLNFSAMWCGPCRSEAGQLMEIYNTYKERGLEIVQVIFQDEDGSPADLEDINRWLKEFGLSFTVLNDSDYSTVQTYDFSSVPTNLIIDRDFIIVLRQAGFDKNQITRTIENAL